MMSLIETIASESESSMEVNDESESETSMEVNEEIEPETTMTETEEGSNSMEAASANRLFMYSTFAMAAFAAAASMC